MNKSNNLNFLKKLQNFKKLRQKILISKMSYLD